MKEDNMNTVIVRPASETSDSSDNSGTGTTSSSGGRYLSKKTLAQGMFDIALLSSNANQLTHIWTVQHANAGLNKAAIALLITSIVLQVIVGVCLIIVALIDTRITFRTNARRKQWSRALNDISTVLVFLITILSVIIPSLTSGAHDQTQSSSSTSFSNNNDCNPGSGNITL